VIILYEIEIMSKDIAIEKLLVILLSIFILFSICGCLDQDDRVESVKDDLIVGVTDPIFGFYPWLESYDVASLSVNHNIFNALVGFDELFRVKAELAESWNNPDNLTWRFRLRKNVKFHNGYELTAEDVKYSIDLVKNDENHVLRDLLISVNKTRVVNNLTVDIITYKPCPILLNKLTDVLIVSKKYQEGSDSKLPVGTGAYKYAEYSHNNYTILERFDDYWKDKPDVKTVTFKVIENSSERRDALLSKEVDIAENILPADYNNLSNISYISLYTVTHPTVVYLSFDFRENNSSTYGSQKNPLSDVRVRKAIYHSINVSEIIERISNKTMICEPASQFVTPLIYGYNPNISRLDYDLDEARRLLNESGYLHGFNLTMDCPIEFYEHTTICEIVDEQLSSILNFSLNIISLEEFFRKILERNTSFYIIGWMAATGDGGEIYDYLIRTVDKEIGTGTYNAGYYSNSEVDRIADEISYTLDFEERLNLMQKGFKIAADDVACIPLVSTKLIYGVKDFINWAPNPNMNIIVEDIELI
jgi:peptide/nickel transport system substrate-binding protein